MIINAINAPACGGYREKTTIAALAAVVLKLAKNEEVELMEVNDIFNQSLSAISIRSSLSKIGQDHNIAFATRSGKRQFLKIIRLTK